MTWTAIFVQCSITVFENNNNVKVVLMAIGYPPFLMYFFAANRSDKSYKMLYKVTRPASFDIRKLLNAVSQDSC